MGVKKKRFAESALLHIVIVFITLLCVLPILWMCLIAVKPASESISGFHSVLVESPTMANFERLFEMIPVLQNTFNSVFTAILGNRADQEPVVFDHSSYCDGSRYLLYASVYQGRTG